MTYRLQLATALAVFIALSTVGSITIAALYAKAVDQVLDASPLTYPTLRILARPVSLRRGDVYSQASVENHLTKLGYCKCDSPGGPGSYVITVAEILIVPRYSEFETVAIKFSENIIADIAVGGQQAEVAEVEPETILAFEHAGPNLLTQFTVPIECIRGSTVADAVLASEDKEFWTHNGVNFERIALAPFNDTGASTITQQVVRTNSLNDRSYTYSRKLSEIFSAMATERKFSKSEILEAYGNSVFLGAIRGRQIRGFQAAARVFFGASNLADLTVLESATLAALANQPTDYLAALRRGDDSLLRGQRNRVLRLMVRNDRLKYGSLDLPQLESQPVTLRMDLHGSDVVASERWFIDYADGDIPHVAGLRVYSTIDAALQREAGLAVGQTLGELEQKHPDLRSQLQAALVVIDPETLEILAMIGGRSYDESQFNRAASAFRQPGSLFKPFVYAARFQRALEEGDRAVSPTTLLNDVPTTFVFDGRPWRPTNYNSAYTGVISMRAALALSKNVPAVAVGQAAGVRRVTKTISTAIGRELPNQFPSIFLGAAEVTPLEMAMAYATFRGGGSAGSTGPLRTIHSVEPSSSELPNATQLPLRRVMDPRVALVVADMLRDVVNGGTAANVRRLGFMHDAAGKTGTTNDLRDAWFVGFTSNLLAVVWVGADDGRPIGLSGSEAAVPIWTRVMESASQMRAAERIETAASLW